MKITHLVGFFALSGAMAAAAAACGGNDTDDGSGGTGGAGVGGNPVGQSSSSTISAGGSGGSIPDESTSCADAVTLEALQNQAGGTFHEGAGVLATPGDSDFFKVSLSAGTWVGLFTDANPDDTMGMIDTVLTLFNADGSTQLAEADDQTPRISVDSELFYRVTQDGDYCIRIQEFSEWNGETPVGDPTFSYRVVALPLDAALYEQYEIDAEPNDTTAAPQPVSGAMTTTNQTFFNFAGVMDTGTDVDVYELTLPAGAVGFSLDFTPGGTDGYGSTKGPGVVNVYGSNGVTVLARLDYAMGSDGFSVVPVQNETSVFIEMNQPNATAGANDFFFFKNFTLDDTQINQQEGNDAGNGVVGGAETATVTPNGMTNSHFIGGETPLADTDFWKFDANAGDEVAVVCSSRRAGSGVQDFTVQFYESDGSTDCATAGQTEPEAEDKDLLWSNAAQGNPSMAAITIANTGTHCISVTGVAEIAGVTSRHYLCGIHVAAP